MPNLALRPRAGPSAKSLLLTILGELVLPHGGMVWTRTVIELLELFDVEERNARQAIARLADQGLVASERRGRMARWHLTAEGHDLLVEGAERIYSFGTSTDEWNEHWLVVLCSVPEDQRAKRHQLRSRLAFAGFGFLGAGVAITPHPDREELANTVLKDLDLVPGAVVLHAEAGSLVPASELLHRAWDLDELAGRYREFTAGFARRAPRNDTSKLTALIELVHAWRRFPFIDPEIPHRLLPRSWPGRHAKELFDARHAAWAPDANRCFERIEAAQP